MSSATAIYLKDTNHVLTAFTRNGTADGSLNDEEVQALFAQKLTLRYFPQTALTPTTDSDLLDNTAPKEFVFEPESLAAIGEALKTPIQDFVKRPAQFGIEKEAVESIPDEPDAFKLKNITYILEEDGLKVTILPTDNTMVASELPVSVLLRREQSGSVFFIRRSDTIQPSTVQDGPAEGKVTFPTISSGSSHQFLLLVSGFRPIWDELSTSEDRTWQPS